MTSRSFVSFKTYAVGFAVVLSPVWLQTPSGCEPGDGTLSTLELEAAGQNQIDFDPENGSYSVWLPVGVEPVLVRAYSTDPAATVWYKLKASVTIAHGKLPDGGGEFMLDTIPSGQTTLTINVSSPSGLVWGTYTVDIGVGGALACVEMSNEVWCDDDSLEEDDGQDSETLTYFGSLSGYCFQSAPAGSECCGDFIDFHDGIGGLRYGELTLSWTGDAQLFFTTAEYSTVDLRCLPGLGDYAYGTSPLVILFSGVEYPIVTTMADSPTEVEYTIEVSGEPWR